MTVSDEGLALIKRFEGFRSKRYLCAAGKPTIGYGHVIQPGEGYLNTAALTEAQASELLRQDMKRYAPAVGRALKGRLVTQHQFDALTSFCYNCGEGAIEKLCAHLNATSTAAVIRYRFGQWCHAKGRVLQDLVVRRKMEADLYLK